MGVVLCAAVLAAAAAVVTGGRWRRGASAGLRHVWLLVVALVLQVAGVVLLPDDRSLQVAVLLTSFAVAGAFVLVNLRVPGLWLVGLGLLANAVVIAANGAMPVSLHAARRAGLAADALVLDLDPRHVAAGSGTTLRWLGDVVPVRFPVAPEIVSVGDLLTAAGVALAVWSFLRRQRASE